MPILVLNSANETCLYQLVQRRTVEHWFNGPTNFSLLVVYWEMKHFRYVHNTYILFTSTRKVLSVFFQELLLYVDSIHSYLISRAHVTNAQLGKDEFSPYIRLIVRGGSNTGDIPPQIIVRPKDLNIVKGKQSSDLHCFTNARYSKYYYYTTKYVIIITIINIIILYLLVTVWKDMQIILCLWWTVRRGFFFLNQ